MEFASRELLIDTPAAFESGASIPRPEYPRPQFVRAEWLCLNGVWEFEIDRTNDGEVRGLGTRALAHTITVPFAPESKLSGIEETDLLEAVWYRRVARIPNSWAGMNLLLHFQASDHDTTVWVNGALVGSHRGGFTPFSFDITHLIDDTLTASIVVRARDDSTAIQARGKQSRRRDNYEAFYTRVTGIWQTVWMEPVSTTRLERPRITPDLDAHSFRFEMSLTSPVRNSTIEIVVYDTAGEVSRQVVDASVSRGVQAVIVVPEGRRASWSPQNPHLYDITFTVRVSGVVVDRVESYAGLRSVTIAGKRVLINGNPIFQRLVLDQGWYPDGLMTAPSDAALVADIELALSAGFNGARLHQKVFEERFLYHADRLGYLVWGEFGDWGARLAGTQLPTASFITQWMETVNRDYSHPSIIGWCPLNETFEPLLDRITVLDDVTLGMYQATKALDRTRPVVDASGYSHRVPGADIYDSHSYEQDPLVFAQLMDGLAQDTPYVNVAEDGTIWSIPYAGQPYFCSEFGGIHWSSTKVAGSDSWGYGQAPVTVEDWYARAKGLFDVLLDNPNMFGYCFTQLTDVFQEENGMFTFDRQPKFDLARLRAIQQRPAAFETDRMHRPQQQGR
ncbi:MAG: glycoside hydrolase family 2 sugar binding protein [Microbacteriaceae bacterium]|jgi:beta-galactosidase/beta-glucuronidase|nr:glycoside hydrolase family 2 sugar binding protein [Microbacteriaceae bacterium]